MQAHWPPIMFHCFVGNWPKCEFFFLLGSFHSKSHHLFDKTRLHQKRKVNNDSTQSYSTPNRGKLIRSTEVWSPLRDASRRQGSPDPGKLDERLMHSILSSQCEGSGSCG
ncbi:hypothetical protein VTI74DRAFT_3560 [Chaetomium olivicolor]